MTFETFILEVVRQRPRDDDWKRQLCYALLGLAGESAAFARGCHAWQEGKPLASPGLLRSVLVPLEVSRALTYYQLDQRPCSTAPAETCRGLREASSDMVLHAGRLVGLVRDWIFHRAWLDRRLEDTCRDFEVARAQCYRLLCVDEVDVWQMYVEGDVAPMPRILNGPLPQMSLVKV